ncbi:MAG TPA: hypothetical protein VMR86_04330 [Myxococcota bacterium]|nr:hypothetical protein [Myxococcota bacterium]
MRIARIAGVLVAVAAGAASGKTLNVSMHGVDSAGCGSPTSPCRTIAMGISEAAAGDTVLVGPGLYGDIDGNGDFTSAGEEPAELGEGSCLCVVRVDKRITLRSRDGAAMTAIDGGGTAEIVVRLIGGAAGATLGGAQNGFTLRRGHSAGAEVLPEASHTHIIGNLAEQNVNGFDVFGANATLTGNRALANTFDGFELDAANVVASGDSAEKNAHTGFIVINGGAEIEKSASIGNAVNGFEASNALMDLHSVVASGNGSYGIEYDDASSDGRVDGSTIVGNALVNKTNCGLENLTNHQIDATGNYWGTSLGPGADPGDAACSDGLGSSVSVTPFKKTELKISLKPLR